MRFSVLSSGSKANCTYIETEKTSILIDCGLSAKQVEQRLSILKIDPASIDAIVVTHEHRDHVFGIPVFSRRHEIPVFANHQTARQLPAVYSTEEFKTGQSFEIGDIGLYPFSIVHDAVEPVGFRVESAGEIFAQATDFGRVTPVVQRALRGAHSLLLESNHDEEMLWTCHYPWDLKQRISSSHGHLSNKSSSALLYELCHSDLLHVILGHISENSNTPELAFRSAEIASEHVKLKTLRCANPYQQTPLFEVAA